MKLIVTFLFIASFAFHSNAQNQFTKEMGQALTMDNSIGTILMDLSTQNKDVLLNGESNKKDTSMKFYPARLFGANQVYISRTIEQNSLFESLQDYSTMGQIYAVFTANGDINNMLKALQINMEKSAVFNMFFKLNKDNKDANRFEYVQSKPFELPNNAAKQEELAKYNKGLRKNFEEYEIRISIEKAGIVSMGTTYEYPQVRSWVQLKPISNLINFDFDLPDNMPIKHEKNKDAEIKAFEKYGVELDKLKLSYEKMIKDFTNEKNKYPGLHKTELRKAIVLLQRKSAILKGLAKFVTSAPKYDTKTDEKIGNFGIYATASLAASSIEYDKVLDAFTVK